MSLQGELALITEQLSTTAVTHKPKDFTVFGSRLLKLKTQLNNPQLHQIKFRK